VHKDRLDLQVILEAQALREQQGRLDLKELLAQLDQLVLPDLQDLREVQDRQVPQDHKAPQVPQEQLDLLEQQVRDILE
jgi:hypothetical protein